MRFTCKDYPNLKDPGDWLAVLPVQISDPLRHSPPCRKFEAVIDSGASICMFHSSIGESIGLNIEKGEKDQTIGVSGAPTVMYRHKIHLHVLGTYSKFKRDFLVGCRLPDYSAGLASSSTTRLLLMARLIHRALSWNASIGPNGFLGGLYNVPQF